MTSSGLPPALADLDLTEAERAYLATLDDVQVGMVVFGVEAGAPIGDVLERVVSVTQPNGWESGEAPCADLAEAESDDDRRQMRDHAARLAAVERSHRRATVHRTGRLRIIAMRPRPRRQARTRAPRGSKTCSAGGRRGASPSRSPGGGDSDPGSADPGDGDHERPGRARGADLGSRRHEGRA